MFVWISLYLRFTISTLAFPELTTERLSTDPVKTTLEPPLSRCDGMVGMEAFHAPSSAGMIRFRFDGFACASQPLAGHPEVRRNIAPLSPGARAAVNRRRGGCRARPDPARTRISTRSSSRGWSEDRQKHRHGRRGVRRSDRGPQIRQSPD